MQSPNTIIIEAFATGGWARNMDMHEVGKSFLYKFWYSSLLAHECDERGRATYPFSDELDEISSCKIVSLSQHTREPSDYLVQHFDEYAVYIYNDLLQLSLLVGRACIPIFRFSNLYTPYIRFSNPRQKFKTVFRCPVWQ